MSYSRVDDAPEAQEPEQVAHQPSNFDEASWMSYFFFGWVKGAIDVGRRRGSFERADLPRADSLDVPAMSEEVETLYAEHRAEGWQGLLRTLWALTRSRLLWAQLLGLVETLISLATPLIISLLIKLGNFSFACLLASFFLDVGCRLSLFVLGPFHGQRVR